MYVFSENWTDNVHVSKNTNRNCPCFTKQDKRCMFLIFWIEVHFIQLPEFFVCCVIFFLFFQGFMNFLFVKKKKENSTKIVCIFVKQYRKCPVWKNKYRKCTCFRKHKHKMYMLLDNSAEIVCVSMFRV